MASKFSAVLLVSPFCVDSTQLSDQNRIRCALLAMKGLRFVEVDGSVEKDYRNKLFSISKHIGKYPQLFIRKTPDESIVDNSNINNEHIFVGLWSHIETLIENDDCLNDNSSEKNSESVSIACRNEKEKKNSADTDELRQKEEIEPQIIGLKYIMRQCFN